MPECLIASVLRSDEPYSKQNGIKAAPLEDRPQLVAAVAAEQTPRIVM